MTTHTSQLLTELSAIVALPIALSVSACGGPSADTKAVDDTNIGEAKAALYGTTTTCVSAPGGFNTTAPPGEEDTHYGEFSISNRLSGCQAWVVTFTYSTPPTPRLQYFWSQARDMPTTAQDCNYSWTSDKVVGRKNGVDLTLHDEDWAFNWGIGCQTSGSAHLPHEGGGGAILYFDRNSSSAQDKLSYYDRIRFINQPFWVYWAVPGRVNYFSSN